MVFTCQLLQHISHVHGLDMLVSSTQAGHLEKGKKVKY